MSERRTLTQDELRAEATALYGADPRGWKFVCPGCGDVATALDFAAVGAPSGLVGQECIGRYSSDGRGCRRAAYGLIAGPWEVMVPVPGAGLLGQPERSIWAFPLAE